MYLKGLGPDVTERSGKGKFKGKAWGRKGFFFFGAPQKEASEGLFGREKGRLLQKEAQRFFDFPGDFHPTNWFARWPQRLHGESRFPQILLKLTLSVNNMSIFGSL